MKIRVKDWNIFEKENHFRFTRDINISNIIDCLGVVSKKNIIYYLVLADFYTFKKIMLIKSTRNIELIDSKFDRNVYFVENKKYYFFDEVDNVKLLSHYDWVVAEKWLIEHDNFLALVDYNSSLAMEIFKENN